MTTPRAIRRLWIALAFLTRLPVPRVEAAPGEFAQAARLYPVAGAVVGTIVAGAGWLGSLVDPWLGALMALGAWIAVTGALHLDGLGDLADGLGAAHGDRERLLSVMADPHIGSFGVVAIVFQLCAKLVLLHLLLPGGAIALFAIPAVARIAPLIWARWLMPLRTEGLGATIANTVRGRDLAGWIALLMLAGVALPPLWIAPVGIVVLALWLGTRVGGVTGDVHGAGIEMIETMLLVGFVILGS